MIGKTWEIRKVGGGYKAVERRSGKDGFCNSVDEMTGAEIVGSLKNVRDELARRGMTPLPHGFERPSDVLEIWTL